MENKNGITKQMEELQELVEPLQEYLTKYYDLMCEIVVDKYSAKVVRTEIGVFSKEHEEWLKENGK